MSASLANSVLNAAALVNLSPPISKLRDLFRSSLRKLGISRAGHPAAPDSNPSAAPASLSAVYPVATLTPDSVQPQAILENVAGALGLTGNIRSKSAAEILALIEKRIAAHVDEKVGELGFPVLETAMSAREESPAAPRLTSGEHYVDALAATLGMTSMKLASAEAKNIIAAVADVAARKAGDRIAGLGFSADLIPPSAGLSQNGDEEEEEASLLAQIETEKSPAKLGEMAVRLNAIRDRKFGRCK